MIIWNKGERTWEKRPHLSMSTKHLLSKLYYYRLKENFAINYPLYSPIIAVPSKGAFQAKFNLTNHHVSLRLLQFLHPNLYYKIQISTQQKSIVKY